MHKPGLKQSPGDSPTLGGVGIGPSSSSAGGGPLPGSKTYAIPDKPARDSRFWPCRFYWPDIVDPAYPYGEGMQLQLRSAISHLNEVWAIENGGLMLSAFADVLPGSGSTMLRAGPTMNRATAAWVTNG